MLSWRAIMHSTPSTDTPPAYAARAARLQRLYVELLFRERLRQRWSQDQQTVLRQYLLPPDAGNLFPNVNSKAFRNECLGRRSLIARELHPQFSNTLMSVYGIESVRDFVSSAMLSRFLESGHFLTIGHSLPHPYGIGKGYENSSKFFLWLRDVHFARQQRLRVALHHDFAMHLIRQSQHCVSNPLLRARNGVLFRAKAREDEDWLLVDSTLKMQQFSVRELPGFLSGPGFFLDQVDETGNYTELPVQRAAAALSGTVSQVMPSAAATKRKRTSYAWVTSSSEAWLRQESR